MELRLLVELPLEGAKRTVVIEVSNEGREPKALPAALLCPRVIRTGVLFEFRPDVWVEQLAVRCLMREKGVVVSLAELIELEEPTKQNIKAAIEGSGRAHRYVGTAVALAPGEKLCCRTVLEVQKDDVVDMGLFSLDEWYKAVRKQKPSTEFWTGALYISVPARMLLLGPDAAPEKPKDEF